MAFGATAALAEGTVVAVVGGKADDPFFAKVKKGIDDATLAGFIQRHAAAAAEVWIVDPDRGNRPVFTRLMADSGFGLTQQRLDTAATATAPLYKGRLLVYQRAA